MPRSTIARALLLAALVIAAACGDSTPTTPAAATPVPATPAPPAPPAPPAGPVAQAVGIFGAPAPLEYPLSHWTVASRFVLRQDGTFALQFDGFEYRGTYAVAENNVQFSWEGWSVAGPWGATGTLTETTLTVRYNLIMAMSDFEDAVYTRTN
jgi:hypothetical protein